MKPLIILLAVFSVSVFAVKIYTHSYDIALSGRMALVAMLILPL